MSRLTGNNTGKERSSIYDTDKGRAIAIAKYQRGLGSRLAKDVLNAKFLREAQVGSVCTGVVPSLYHGSKGKNGDRPPEGEWLVPSVITSSSQNALVRLGDVVACFEISRMLGSESSSSEELGIALEAMGVAEGIHTVVELLLAQAS